MDNSVHTIDVNSGNLGSSKRKVFMTKDSLVIYEDIIDYDEIKSVTKSDYNPKDLHTIGIGVTNVFVVMYASWILELDIYVSILLYLSTIFITYLIARRLRTDIYSYVSIKTKQMEYLIGVVNEEDVEKLLNINSEES